MKNTLRNILVSIATFSIPVFAFSVEEDYLRTYTLPTYTVVGIISDPMPRVAAKKPYEKTYDLPAYTIEDIAVLPKPVGYPIPAVSKALVGTTVKVRFTINEEGRPKRVRLVKPLFCYPHGPKMDFACQLKIYVRNWKFEPARDQNGNAIPVNVILPVKVVKKDINPAAVLALVLDFNNKT